MDKISRVKMNGSDMPILYYRIRIKLVEVERA